MPLRWILCPVSRDAVEIPDCLACAANYDERPVRDRRTGRLTGETAHCQYPYPYLKRLSENAEGRKLAGLSTTMVTGCLRQSYLQGAIDYAVDPGEQMAATSGTAWHDFLEGANEGDVLAEFRLRVTLPSGRQISGKVDRLKITPAHRRSLPGTHEETPEFWYEDYKRKATGKIFTQPPDYYAWQLNIYRALLLLGGEVIEQDHHKILTVGQQLRGEITRLRLLPSEHEVHGFPVEVPFFPLEEVVAYLEECAALFAAATPAAPPPAKADPTADYFCNTFCPLNAECRQYGYGEAGGPYDILGEYTRRVYEAGHFHNRKVWRKR